MEIVLSLIISLLLGVLALAVVLVAVLAFVLVGQAFARGNHQSGAPAEVLQRQAPSAFLGQEGA